MSVALPLRLFSHKLLEHMNSVVLEAHAQSLLPLVHRDINLIWQISIYRLQQLFTKQFHLFAIPAAVNTRQALRLTPIRAKMRRQFGKTRERVVEVGRLREAAIVCVNFSAVSIRIFLNNLGANLNFLKY
jgi:hypothetical protein